MKNILKGKIVSSLLAFAMLVSAVAFLKVDVHAQTAGNVLQYRSNHTTQIANGGSTSGDTFIYLDGGLPASTSNTTQQAECPVSNDGTQQHILTQVDASQDFTSNGFEIKPSNAVFNDAGLVPATTQSGTVVSLKYTTGAAGTYHWMLWYTETDTTVNDYCDGTSQTFTTNTQKGTSQLSFVVPNPSGSVTVTSKNSVSTGTLVPANWDFTTSGTTPPTDPCAVSGNVCTNTSQATYSNAGVGTYTINPTSASGYSLRTVGTAPIAEAIPVKTNGLEKLLSFGKSIFGSVAHAFSFPQSNPQAQSLTSGGTTSFIILWDPVAAMTVSPATVALSSGSPSATVTITNSGSPGSSLTWSSSITGGTWLSASPNSNTTGLLALGTVNKDKGNIFYGVANAAGASQTVTLSANTSGLQPGTYNASITFNGASAPGTPSSPIRVTIPVSLNVSNPSVCGNGVLESPEQCDSGASNGVCPATCSSTCQTQSCPVLPACSFSANPTKIVPPQASNLNYNCTNVNACSISGGQFGAGQPLTVTSNNASGTLQATPNVDTTYTLTCTGLQSGNSNYQKTVNVQVTVTGSGRKETNP